jgi:hypothetical protein
MKLFEVKPDDGFPYRPMVVKEGWPKDVHLARLVESPVLPVLPGVAQTNTFGRVICGELGLGFRA